MDGNDKFTKREMIRLDEEDAQPAKEGWQDVLELPENQQVPMTVKLFSEFTTRSGIRFQRCGGGRRRLAHRGVN